MDKGQNKHLSCVLLFCWRFSENYCYFSQVSTSVPANPKEGKCEKNIQKVVSPESYVKHPLQNK